MTEAIYSEVKKAEEQKGRSLPVRRMLDILGVSKNGYYSWKGRGPSSQEKRKQELQHQIMDCYEGSKQIYGSPKITKELNAVGIQVSESTVTRYMQEMGIHAWYRRPYIVTTQSIDFTEKLKNILDQEFSPEEPNCIWCTDITYVHTVAGFCYLSCIMDLYSRKIIAWELGKTLETESVLKAVRKAIARTGKRPKVIHTDRGVQYTSDAYREITEGMERSYSAKGSPWDNACIESFHALIKREWLWRFRIRDYDHAYRLIFEYIDAFYNTVRIHSHCGYRSPEDYEKGYYARLKDLKGRVA